MLTKPTAMALWSKIGSAPVEWFMSPEGRQMMAKALRLVRRVDGRDEAKVLRSLITSAFAVRF